MIMTINAERYPTSSADRNLTLQCVRLKLLDYAVKVNGQSPLDNWVLLTLSIYRINPIRNSYRKENLIQRFFGVEHTTIISSTHGEEK